MIKYLLGQEILLDSTAGIDKARAAHNSKRARVVGGFRVYSINNTAYKAKGYWMDSGKLYKDRINFLKYKDYNSAKKQAEHILKTTSELAISIEDINNNTLYIIYKDGRTDILRIKYTYKSICKRTAINYIRKLTAANGGATVEYIKGYYIISSYK